jgi:hypothetical protein
MMHRRHAVGVRDFAVLHGAVDNPVVADFHAAGDFAFQVSQGVCQKGEPLVAGRVRTAGEAVGTGGKALEEVLHQGQVFAFFQNIQHKLVAHLHQGFDRPVFSHGHGEAQGLEAGLVHPGGQHGAGQFPFLGGDDVQSAADAAQGFF